MRGRSFRPSAASITLAAILAAGLGLRLWGAKHGLPAVYNLDEGAHFVKPAVRFFGEGYNPQYFQNPPLFSYILHLVYAFAYGGIWPARVGHDIRVMFDNDPTQLYTIGRVLAGLMGLAAAVVVYFTGKKLFGIVAGLIAAALMSLTFIPVQYGHLALNDSPTLLPLTLCILASVYIYERGTWTTYLLAGTALGFSVATKYTSLAVVFVIITAFALRVYNDRSLFRVEFPRLVAAGAASAVAFVIGNPYALLTPGDFAGGVKRQQHYSANVPKLGLDEMTGWQYYLWTAMWGFGWAPLAAAVVGAGMLLKQNWQKALLLLGFFFVFWFFMGRQERFYARWFLPVYPILALLAGYTVQRAVDAVPKRAAAYAVGIGLGVLLVAQGVVTNVHTNKVLTQTDTRYQARQFLRAHLPYREHLVLEPIASAGFARESESLTAKHRWNVYSMNKNKKVRVEDYQGTLNPELLDEYAAEGYCVVVVGSTQYGRAAKEADEAPKAVAYYRALDSDATLVAKFSPVQTGDKLPDFNFDKSFNYYSPAYHRPGPEVKIYKLNNGKCASRNPLSDPTVSGTK